MIPKMSPNKVQHLLLRAGFGATPSTIQSFSKLSHQKAVDRIFQASKASQPITLFKFSPPKNKLIKNAPPAIRKELRKKRRQDIKKLNTHWLMQLATAESQLREKMTLFWHDHFAARVEHPFGLQDLNNTMRKHALGNFKTLLTDVSKHPVMLDYLNNRQNKKASPNENFARELMELFTLGVGHYTEKDIKEAARAFTGWNFNQEGEFVFRKRQHDEGMKTFRGKSGRLTGEDIIAAILEDKQTARHISAKLYRFFVHPENNERHTEAIATVLYDSNYNIEAAVRHIFEAPWFTDERNIGARIKSPAEFIAGMVRSLSIKVENPDALFQIQKILGQVLFNPPNVSGWPEDRGWIDSSTLSARMTIPSAILLAADTGLRSSGDLMDMGDGKRQLKKLQKIKAKINWEPLLDHVGKAAGREQAELLADLLLQVKPANLDPIEHLAAGQQGADRTKLLAAHLTALPEYQLA